MSRTDVPAGEVTAGAAPVIAATPPDRSGTGPTVADLRPRRGALRRLLASEIALVFRRRRNLALLAVLAGPPILIGIAVKSAAPRNGEGPAFLGAITGNGLFLVFTAITVCLPLFLPLVVGVVGGDSVAGEASSGTIRYLLTIPVSRTRLLLAKGVGVAHVRRSPPCSWWRSPGWSPAPSCSASAT